jgi:excisionase family DNA binding protein
VLKLTAAELAELRDAFRERTEAGRNTKRGVRLKATPRPIRAPVKKPADGDILTTRDFAEVFAVSPRLVRQWADAGKLPLYRTLGGHLRFRWADVKQWLNQTSADRGGLMKRRKRRKKNDGATRDALDRLWQQSPDPAAIEDEATEDEATDELTSIWRQRFKNDAERALKRLQAKVKDRGYRLAYAGRTFGAPVTERTYYVIHADGHEPIQAFGDGSADLTLFDVCLWCEQATAQSPDLAGQSPAFHGVSGSSAGNGATPASPQP